MALCVALRVLLAFGLEFYLSASATSFQQPAHFSNLTSDNVYYSSPSPSGGTNSVVELITTGPGLLSASSPLTSRRAKGWCVTAVSLLFIPPFFSPSPFNHGIIPPTQSTQIPLNAPRNHPLDNSRRAVSVVFGENMEGQDEDGYVVSVILVVYIYGFGILVTRHPPSLSSPSTLPPLPIPYPPLSCAFYERLGKRDVAPKLDGGQDSDSSSSKASSPTRSSTSDHPSTSSAQSKSLLLLALRIHLSLDAIILLPPLVMLILAGPGSRLMEPGAFVLATPSSGKQQDVQVEGESKAEINSNAETVPGSESKSKSNDETQAESKSSLRPQSHPILRAVFPVILEFFVYFAALSLVSTLIVGHWGWMGSTWGASLSLPSLTPNPGLWWYFFTEMFDHFRAFFLVVFEVHLLMYVAPICIKFQHDPLYALFLLTGILATFKPYPTLSDQGLFLVMWGIFGEVYPFLRTPLPALLTLLHSTLLQPLFAHLWLTHGRGNANFYYATTLVGACAGGMGVVDAVWGGLRCALEKGETGKYSNTGSVDEEWEESEVVTQQ
ncbi:PIG-U-domain-containing protein [Lentinula edodes]|uniref:PIG-U-domain-containing protein n=1 Tax=Lentinula edodes TaxID=5353 RepID=A0A1Q3ENB6_LENED|nr:PIG-U-domain-containing protein [Lentinula edodes]